MFYLFILDYQSVMYKLKPFLCSVAAASSYIYNLSKIVFINTNLLIVNQL